MTPERLSLIPTFSSSSPLPNFAIVQMYMCPPEGVSLTYQTPPTGPDGSNHRTPRVQRKHGQAGKLPPRILQPIPTPFFLFPTLIPERSLFQASRCLGTVLHMIARSSLPPPSRYINLRRQKSTL